MLLFVSQLNTVYPALAQFTKEKGWRCGKSFISHRSKCYRNPKTGKIATKYIVNSKTGRKNKVKVGLNYKEYQKARTKAIKKKGQGKKVTKLEEKYIFDAQRLATSTKKKKQRSLDAKIKRKEAKKTPADKTLENSKNTRKKLNNLVDKATQPKLDKEITKLAQDKVNGVDIPVERRRNLQRKDPKGFTDKYKQKLIEEIDRVPDKKEFDFEGRKQYKDYRENVVVNQSSSNINEQIKSLRDDLIRKDSIAIQPNSLRNYRALRLAQKDYAETRSKLGWDEGDIFNPKKEDILSNWDRPGSPKANVDEIKLPKNRNWAKSAKADIERVAKTLDRYPELSNDSKYDISKKAHKIALGVPDSYSKSYKEDLEQQIYDAFQYTGIHSKARNDYLNGRAVDSDVNQKSGKNRIVVDIKNFADTVDPKKRQKNLETLKKGYEQNSKDYDKLTKTDNRRYNQNNIEKGKLREVERLLGNKERGKYENPSILPPIKSTNKTSQNQSQRSQSTKADKTLENSKNARKKLNSLVDKATESKIQRSQSTKADKTKQSKSQKSKAPNASDAYKIIDDLDKEFNTDNYLEIYRFRDRIKKDYPDLKREEVDKVLYDLQSKDSIDIGTLAEIGSYSNEQRKAGIPQVVGGDLFFISKEKAPDAQGNKTTQSKSQVKSFDDYVATSKRINEGNITAEEIKQSQLDLRENESAIKADLNKFKKDRLIRMAGWGVRMTDKKAALVNSSYDSMEQGLLPPGAGTLSYSYSFGANSREETRKNRRAAIDKKMEGWTDDLIKDTAKERKQAKAAKEKAISDPKTIDDFRTIVSYKGKEGLTPKQRRAYEELVTVRNRDERKQKAPKAEAIELPANKSFKLSQTTHSKKGHDVYVASLADRVDRDKYNELNRRAKTMGGYYSRYARDGAVPGFQFRDEETARKFMGLEEVEGGKRTEKKQAAKANTLRSSAEKIIERNEEKLNRGGLRNTARRARMAANTDDDARAAIAIAKTMQNLADDRDDGNIQFLDNVKAATEVRQLSSILSMSQYKAAREIAKQEYPKDKDWDKQRKKREEIENKAIDDDIIEYAEYPYPSIHKDNLRKLLDEAESQKGMKLLANRLRKKHKAIANKDSYIIDLQKPKDIEDLRRLVSQGNYSKDVSYPLDFAKGALQDYDRINKTLDLKTPYELRAGLREFNRLRSKKASEDPIKAKERALIGRKIDGYFPTPKPLVDKMLDLADLKTGQRVLEPSAGKGNIADRLREKVGNDTVSTIEIDRDLSEILDAKGYNNRRDNFLNLANEEYDRIVMNPPFEKLQDVDHVRQAYDLLAPGGRLVSVMSASPFFQQQKKAKDFRDWLTDKDGYSQKNPDGSFKDSERSTSVNTRIVVIEKPYEEKKRKVDYSSPRNNRIIKFSRGSRVLRVLSNK